MATILTPTEVKAYAEKFTSLSDPKVQLFIDAAALWLNEGKWGRKFKQGWIFMTCHLLEVDSRMGASGQITSESVGELSVSYGSVPNDDELNDTSYGRQFVSLRRTIRFTPMVL